MSVTKDTYCNNKAHVVNLNTSTHALRLYFSYDTCVGVEYWTKRGEVRVHSRARMKNHWGPTTGRHMSHTGCKDFPEFSDDEFEQKLDEAVGQYALSLLNNITTRLAA